MCQKWSYSEYLLALNKKKLNQTEYTKRCLQIGEDCVKKWSVLPTIRDGFIFEAIFFFSCCNISTIGVCC